MSLDQLDETSRALIESLMREPRATHRQLAAELGLNEVTIAARIRRLAESGVLASTIAVDWRAAGYTHSAYLWLSCVDRSPIEVANDVGLIDGVQNVALVLGDADLFVHVLLPGDERALIGVKDEVGSIAGASVLRTNVILEHFVHRTDVTSLPIVEPALPALPAPVIALDDLDVALCEKLAADARRSNREIARELSTSERTVRARLRRLEDSGLIRIVTMIDRNARQASNVNAFIGIRTRGSLDKAATALMLSSRVSALTATTGDADLYVIAAAETSDELADWIAEDVRTIPEVSSTKTALIGRSLKFGTRLRRLV